MNTKTKAKEKKQTKKNIKKAKTTIEYEQMLIDFVKDEFKEVL